MKWGVFIASNGDDGLDPGWTLMKWGGGEPMVFDTEARALSVVADLMPQRPYNVVEARPMDLPALPEDAYAPGAEALPERTAGVKP